MTTTLKTHDEIKTILVDQLGLTDLAAYERWSRRFCWTGSGPMAVPRRPTKQDIELLSPDLIDNNAFWRIAEELFKTDPVANCNGVRPFDVVAANRNNLQIYRQNGCTSIAEWCKQAWEGSRIPLLEIGPGYGAFKEWIGALGGFDYYAADVYPRIPGVDATHIDGTLTGVTKERRYALVIASNVFQHLSVAQRRTYYEGLYDCMLPAGLFMVSMILDDGTVDPGIRCEDGHVWCRHYGQLTQIQREYEIRQDLQKHFTIERMTTGPGHISVVCSKPDGRRYAR